MTPHCQFCRRTRREFLWASRQRVRRRCADRPARPRRSSPRRLPGRPARQPARRRSRRTSRPRRRASSSCFMYGGPSQVDTFDYKPASCTSSTARRSPIETFGRGGHSERRPRRRAEVAVQAVRPVRHVGQRPVPAHRDSASTTSPSSTRCYADVADPRLGDAADEHGQHPERPPVPRLVGHLRPGQREREPARLRRHARSDAAGRSAAPRTGRSGFMPAAYPGDALPARATRRSSTCAARRRDRARRSGA